MVKYQLTQLKNNLLFISRRYLNTYCIYKKIEAGIEVSSKIEVKWQGLNEERKSNNNTK